MNQHLRVEPKPRTPDQDRSYHKRRALIGAGLLALAIGAGPFVSRGHRLQTADEARVCEPQGQQTYTFQPGEGKDAAVHAIAGSGAGEGDPCWSEAEQAVEEALGQDQYGNVSLPQPGQQIEIPAREVPSPQK